MTSAQTGSAPARLAVVQGLYYVATGIWPLVSMRTFEAVTGPKTDRWLVRTVGILAAVIGVTLLRDGLRGDPGKGPDRTLAAAAAAGFTVIDVVYVLRGRISPVYLLDAVAELGLALAWVLLPRRVGAAVVTHVQGADRETGQILGAGERPRRIRSG